MSKVVFFGFPAHGHTNPTLALVKELVSRGEHVIYYSFDDFREKIEQTGAEFRSCGHNASQYAGTNTDNLTLLFRIVMEAGYRSLVKLYPEMMKESPDYIIHDSFCCWGKYFAVILNIPAISSVTIFPVSEKNVKLSKKTFITLFNILIIGRKDLYKGLAVQKRIAQEYHIKKYGFIDAFFNKEALNIVYTSQAFQPNGELFDSTYKFVGPSITERKENTEILIPEWNTLPVIYISLGTVVNLNADFYAMCFKALADMQALIILSVGQQTDLSSLPDAPANFIIRNYVAQLDVLSTSDCFITHGGMNSIHEGLYYGVPLVVVPQTQEQKDVAERVEATHTGIFLRTITPQAIKESVAEIFANKDYKSNALKLGESFSSAGGFKKAADEILRYIRQAAVKT